MSSMSQEQPEPKKPNRRDPRHISLYLSEELYDRVLVQARREERSMSAMCRVALWAHLAKAAAEAREAR